jgi:hypothetical protein
MEVHSSRPVLGAAARGWAARRRRAAAPGSPAAHAGGQAAGGACSLMRCGTTGVQYKRPPGAPPPVASGTGPRPQSGRTTVGSAESGRRSPERQSAAGGLRASPSLSLPPCRQRGHAQPGPVVRMQRQVHPVHEAARGGITAPWPCSGPGRPARLPRCILQEQGGRPTSLRACADPRTAGRRGGAAPLPSRPSHHPARALSGRPGAATA